MCVQKLPSHQTPLPYMYLALHPLRMSSFLVISISGGHYCTWSSGMNNSSRVIRRGNQEPLKIYSSFQQRYLKCEFLTLQGQLTDDDQFRLWCSYSFPNIINTSLNRNLKVCINRWLTIIVPNYISLIDKLHIFMPKAVRMLVLTVPSPAIHTTYMPVVMGLTSRYSVS